MAVQHPQTFTLVADTKSGIAIQQVTIKIQGAKGTDFPDEDSVVRFPVSTTRTVSQKSTFIQNLHDLLQNDLHFAVRTLAAQQNSARLTFLTNKSERKDLVRSDEKAIKSRRLAFKVEADNLDKQNSPIKFTVSMLIEYLRRGELTWHVEGSQQFYEQQGHDFLLKIAQLRTQ